MKLLKRRFLVAFSLLFLSQLSFADSGEGANYLLFSLIAIGVVLLIFAILSLADNLIQIEAKKSNVDTTKHNLGIFPRVSSLFGAKAPSYTGDADYISSKKGFDLKLAGVPNTDIIEDGNANRYAVKPTDFNGISPIPKVVVAVGDEVKAGDELFFDKKRPEIKYVSPVSGEVVEINRGAKRAISEVVILADKQNTFRNFEAPSIETASSEDIKAFMAESGVWTYVNQRPFDIVADLNDSPKNIFISTFSTAPLAADSNLLIAGKEKAFQKGLDVLDKLTEGDVYLGLDGRGKSAPAAAFANATGVKKTYFSGKHPMGNVGIQIHHTAPINGTDKVWTLGVQEVATIGELFLNGNYDASRIVAVGGSPIARPMYVKTYQGANIGDLVSNNISEQNVRLIAGDVLTGEQVDASGYLGFTDTQITSIKEGDDYEAFGWLLPIKPRPSISNTFPNFLFPDFKFEGETNTHGEKRAFVVSGQYESVLPMDIYPMHLAKAIMAGDFERMEGLGINELSEEDVALCEFVCTSKTPLQSIIRDGLEMMREQG